MTTSAIRVAALIETGLLVAGASPTSPLTALLSLGIANGVVSEITVNALVPGATLIAPSAGGPCTGSSTITGLSAARLKAPIKTALIDAGASDIAVTDLLALDLATAVVSEVHTYATVPAAGLVATNTLVSPGTVTGTATIASVNAVRLGTAIASALVTSGAASGAVTAALGAAIASAIVVELLTFAAVTPVPPPIASAGGGPLIGALSVA